MRIAAIFAAILLMLGLGVSQANAAQTALPAGNGTSNFYLTGGCNPWPGAPTLGLNMKFTNYDSNSGQIYHVSWTRSGIAYAPVGLYIDGVKYGTSSDQYVYIAGHGAHWVTFKSSLYGTVKSCTVWK